MVDETLSTGLLRAATREDLLKYKCLHGEQIMHKCKEFSAKVSQSINCGSSLVPRRWGLGMRLLWEQSHKPATCLLSSRKASISRLLLASTILRPSASRSTSSGRELSF